MSMTSQLFSKYLNQFDDLLKEGEQIINTIGKPIPYLDGEPGEICGHRVSIFPLASWQTSCITLLDQIITKNHIHRSIIEEFSSLQIDYYNEIIEDKGYLIKIIAKFRAIRNDFEKGLLDDLSLQIESAISSDYMGQAESLLEQKYYVPAAVLAGAVLEKALRTLCNKQDPPIPTQNDKKSLMMNSLIDKLKTADVFNESKVKQLRAWTDIRNDAAHGNHEKFNYNGVKYMIDGIKIFLEEYLN